MEFDKDNHVNRIVFSVPHPEYFNRYRGTVVTHTMRANALKERLMDFAMVKVWGSAHLQGFLSTAKHLFQIANGLIVRVQDIENYGEDNETLRTMLSIPTLNNSPLDNFMSRNKNMSEEQVKGIKNMRNEVNVTYLSYLSFEYWLSHSMGHLLGRRCTRSPHTRKKPNMSRAYIDARSPIS